MARITDFKQMEIWKASHDLAVSIYKITLQEKFSKDFGFRDQMRRSAVSVPSNIAEGFGRTNNKEFVHYLRIARGSCSEVITLILIAYKVGYLVEDIALNIAQQYEDLIVKIGRFSTYLKKPKVRSN